MKKKIFGIKLSTILSAIGCIAIAFVIWVIAKYNIDYPSLNEAEALLGFVEGML
jgi:hypothetical protein